MKRKEEPDERKAVDDYIAGFDPPIRERLTQIREIVHEIVPDAKERISYGMPTFRKNGNLIHYAGYARHVGLYPLPHAMEVFEEELKSYPRGKGSVQFPHDRPLPIETIRRIVEYRVGEKRDEENSRKLSE